MKLKFSKIRLDFKILVLIQIHQRILIWCTVFNKNNNNNIHHYHKRLGACLIPNGSVYIESRMNCCALFTRLNSPTASSAFLKLKLVSLQIGNSYLKIIYKLKENNMVWNTMSRAQYMQVWDTHSKAWQVKYIEVTEIKNVG